MRPLAEPSTVATPAAPPFGEGIARYVELFRDQPPAPDLATLRLNGDLGAARFAQGAAFDIRQFDSSIAEAGREIPVRVYDPGGTEHRPAICYFHGGGFSMGSIESFDLACAGLSAAAGAVVVSVHYRRLPGADYAAAQADCDTGFAWMLRHAQVLGIDPTRAGVAGDSAGALLALACSANQRDAKLATPAFQLLFYGTFAMDPARAAYDASQDPLLTGDRVRSYIDLFGKCGGLEHHPAPVERSDLAGLPPTHIVAAELDPLCSEALELGERLQDAGVPTSVQVAPGMIHGFLRAIGVSNAAQAQLELAAAALRTLLEDSQT